MSTTNEIIEKLKNLTLVEASELVAQIEETFGVDASAPISGSVMMAPSQDQAGGSQESVEEKTTFDVVVGATRF